MSHGKSAAPVIPTPTDGGSNMGLYIGLGVFALLAAGGVGYYMYSSTKKKEEDAKKKAAAATDANGVPLIVNGKPVIGKDGTPVMVDPSTVQAGKPAVGGDGQPITASDGKPAVPSAADIKAMTGATDSAGGGSSATTGSSVTNSGASSNNYVQGSTIDQRNASTYVGYSPTSPDEAALQSTIVDVLNLTQTPKHKLIQTKKAKKKAAANAAAATKAALVNAEKYVRGFLKGMNLAVRSDYVGAFQQPINDYMNNPAKLMEADVTSIGLFLPPPPPAIVTPPATTGTGTATTGGNTGQ